MTRTKQKLRWSKECEYLKITFFIIWTEVNQFNTIHLTSRSKPWVSNYPLAALLGKMAEVFGQRSEGCEFESQPGPNSVVPQIWNNIKLAYVSVILRACAIEIIHLTSRSKGWASNYHLALRLGVCPKIRRLWVWIPPRTKFSGVSDLKKVLTLKVLNFWTFTYTWSGWIFDSYCSLKPLCSGMGEVVPARTSPTLPPPSPRTVL